MKHVLLIFFILVSCKEKNAIENQRGKIKIIPIYCKLDYQNYYLSNPDFRLFQKNNEEVELLEGIKTFVSDLKFGEYYIEYKSIFNKINRVDFTISNNEQMEIRLCCDKLNYETNDNVLLIDELKENDVLKVRFDVLGCFHNFNDELKITKVKTNFILEYNEIKYQLNRKQLRLVREFEIELRSNHSSGCSTKETYSIYNVNSRQIYTTNDESCRWRGFENLIRLLDLKQKDISIE